MRSLNTMALVCALVMAGAAAPAFGVSLLATTGNGCTGPSVLLELDPATGATLQVIGPVGYWVNGLAYDPASGKLYGSTSYTDPNYNGLIEIDMSTGAGTPIGPSGWGWAGDPGDSNCGIFSPVTNLTIDAGGQMYGWLDPCADDLVKIDKTTGIATRVGDAGIGTAVNGLDFDNSGTLYMIQFGDVFQVDTSSGAASYVGSYPNCCYHHGDFNPDTNLYYAVGPSTCSGSKSLEIVDVAALTLVGTLPTARDLHVLTFVDLDEDGDGVPDDLDVCPDTVIPEGVPTKRLEANRWALVDEDGIFDTTLPPGGGNGPGRSYTIEETAGCSCEQIIAAQGLGKGHTKYGCSISAMDTWVAMVNP